MQTICSLILLQHMPTVKEILSYHQESLSAMIQGATTHIFGGHPNGGQRGRSNTEGTAEERPQVQALESGQDSMFWTDKF